MKALAPIFFLLILAGVVFGAVILAPMFGLNLFAAGAGDGTPTINVETACDDDGLVRLVAGYQDSFADDAAFVAVDARLYEYLNGKPELAFTNDDETSATFGTYNEVSTNVLVCKHEYVLWLGDETEEYFRTSGTFIASGSEKKVLVDGTIIGGETWSGFDQGTLEATTNLTLGSGATSNNLKLEYQSSTARQGHEAPNGMILATRYNDTAWLDVKPTGVSDFNGEVKSNGKPIEVVACPDVVSRTLMTISTDMVNKCYRLPITSTADGGSFDIPIYLALETGVNPDDAVGCNGGLETSCAITFVMLDQNYFQATETTDFMELGYEGDDEDNIGEATTTTKIVYFD